MRLTGDLHYFKIILTFEQLLPPFHDAMLTVDIAHTALRQAGLRITAQRLLVIDALIDNRTHPTVEEIHSHVQQRFPTISLATVYQTLARLAQQGLIRELRGGKDGMRCDPDTSPHGHAYCEGCGLIFDMPLDTERTDEPLHLTGFVPYKTEIFVYGLCDACHTSLPAPSTPGSAETFAGDN